MFEIQSPKTREDQEKMVPTLSRTNAMQQMQVPNGTGHGVRKS